ncbi:MAG: MaoC family dehydratase [Methyloligellaceae bacterium]
MNDATQPVYWEDFEPGRTVALGERRVTRQEIIAFAAEFDPQPIHLDENAARNSILGGLSASGWHSCALLMRMICDAYLVKAASLGSPGLDEIRFAAPVRPDDVLRARFTCLEKRPSNSRPDTGICKISYEVFNQHDELVLSWTCTQFFGRRSPGEAA